MEGFGLDVQDPLGPGGGEAPGLLDQEGDGVALVEQAQLQRQEVQDDEDFYTKQKKKQLNVNKHQNYCQLDVLILSECFIESGGGGSTEVQVSSSSRPVTRPTRGHEEPS